MRVLIAEDDGISRTILEKIVKQLGHECLVAEDGEKAWNLFQSTSEVDVIISDWRMPGVDGLELCRRVRRASRPEYTFFVFLTVLGEKQYLLEGMQAGADDYLAKPLDQEQLRVRLIAASRVTSLHRQLRQEIAERERAEEAAAAQMRYTQLRAEVSETLARSGSLEDTLQGCAGAMVRHLDSDLTCIWTFDGEEGVLELRASAGLYEATGGPLRRVSVGGKTGGSVQGRQPYVTDDILDDLRFEEKEWADREGFVATVSYPLIVEDRLVGTISVYAREPLPDHALEAVTSIADAIAQGIKRKLAEEALRETEELFRNAFDNAPIGIAVSSTEGHYLRVNRALCDILGYSEKELRATSFQALTHPEDYEVSMTYVDRLLEGEIDKYSLEKRYVRADGHPVWVSLDASLVRAPDDRPLYYVAQVQDITERKLAEERLREANRHLEELATLRADFIAMVAHEFGSPLAAIRGFLEVLATGELEPADRDDALAKIRSEIDGLSILVADVSGAATVERSDFTLLLRRTSIDELFEDAARYAAVLPGEHPLTIKAEVGGQMLVDPYRIGQVLRNLLSNAAKYSPEGAPIELRAVPGETPGRLRIEVADHGAGVHPEDVNLIFEKFGRGRDRWSKKAYGVGLGLYLSRRIVRAHGGELTLDSAPGRGSVFSFELEVAG